MFWVLLFVFFHADGTKSAQAFIEPTQQVCVDDAAKRIVDIQANKPAELLGMGVRCVGPTQDPTAPSNGI